MSGSMRKFAAALAIVVVTAGCTSTSAGPTGTVKGVVDGIGGPAGSGIQLLQGTVSLRTGTRDTTVKSDSQGDFVAHVLPGSYTITALSSQYDNGLQSCGLIPPKAISVGAGATVSVVIVCEEK